MMMVALFRKSEREFLPNNKIAKNRVLQEPNTLLMISKSTVKRKGFSRALQSFQQVSSSFVGVASTRFCDMPCSTIKLLQVDKILGAYLFSAIFGLAMFGRNFVFPMFSVTVYTGSSSTGRKFDAAKMGFSPGRPKFKRAENK